MAPRTGNEPGSRWSSISTCVPFGIEVARQPFVSLAAPVLEQWAACPM